MNASPALSPRSGAPRPDAPRPGVAPRAPRSSSALESLPVPARWRAGQFVALGLILLFAVYYNRVFAQWPAVIREIGARNFSHLPVADNLGFLILGAMVWMATPTAGTLAVSTLQEALRRRWVIGFLAFSMVVIAGSSLMSFVQLGQEQRFLQDFGTGFIIGMTILIAIFLGVSLVPPEIERRTILTILSKPVNRLEFLVGKFLGLCLTLLFCVTLLGAFFLLVYVAFCLRNNGVAAWTQGSTGTVDTALGFQLNQIFKAMVLNYGQLCVLAALSMALSLMVTPITAITFCFLAYFGGQMSSYWGHLGGDNHAQETTRGLGKLMQGAVQVVYYALPRMDHFDVRQQLVTDVPVPLGAVWQAWSSGLLYIAVLLLIGYLVFSDREF